ncbi:serine-threonine protein kinase, putative [Bodo saltans]|uniref:Aurora kinase n=1 Tax=Bodo saltans TaxID=75058 RepID=A0A0S4JUJ2_BODSA|nr:serine-threonine protein kinase, putative [Bodo saltans]|eukprot:CUG94079.1 serine-threonine protein kinase, putative [Bodo saltans]
MALDQAVDSLSIRDGNIPVKVKQEQLHEGSFRRNRDVLGRGSYSTVFSATHVSSGSLVALKEISLQWICNPAVKDQLKHEINVHRRLRHPHIVRMFSYYFSHESLVIVMELCVKGSIRDKLDRDGPFKEARASRYVRQTARAIQYLHANRIAHRDIKLENILLDNNGVAKLADFGWSTLTGESSRKTVCGTLDYLSPEMLAGSHTSKTDVWSLGVGLVEMITGSPPFFNISEQETVRNIKEAQPSLPTTLSLELKSLILEMLQKDPDQRISIDDVLANPWVNHDKRQ